MKIIINENNAGKSIRDLLRRDMGFSSAILKKVKFKEGGITVNGNFANVRYTLKSGDELCLSLEDTYDDMSPYMVPADLPIEVLYEDSWLTVINKPPNMPAHPSLGHKLDTVANALAYRYRESPYVFRPVNRLDRDTSGIMLTANSKLAASKLYVSMINGKIRKNYLAVLDNTPEIREGEIRSFIKREENSIVKRCETDNEKEGKEAVTHYRVIASNGKEAAVIASPITGRTHQLRVHFASLGCHIVGDDMYGLSSPLISRHALHACRLTFPHPEDGRNMEIIAGVPDDMEELIKVLLGDCADKIIAGAELND